MAQPSLAQPILPHAEESTNSCKHRRERRQLRTCPFTIKKREKERKKERKRGKEREREKEGEEERKGERKGLHCGWNVNPAEKRGRNRD